MADLTVGLSKSVVEGALTKVRSAIEQDATLRQKAQRDLVTITLEFEMINSFLNVAKDETAKNKLVMTWVRHVRELAYDLEDCVEFIVHLDSKPVFWRRLLPSFMIASSLLPLDQAVMEIEELKGRAEELSKCYMRYSNISESASKLVMQQQQPTHGAALSVTELNMLAEARDAAWRKKDSRDLTQLIIKKDNTHLGVISLWGTGGNHGTASIIRKAYRDPQIGEKFVCRAWVKLMHPFSPQEFVRSFMAQLYANACHEHGVDVGVHVLSKMNARQEDILEEFVQQVKSKTYLVVLENLTHMVDWDAVRMFLPDMKNGSWIIVSTQQLEMASLCVGHSYRIFELKQFTAEHSVCALFKQGSTDYGDKEEKPMMHQVSKKSSYGNPLNLKAISDWMKNNPLVGRESKLNELGSCAGRARFSNSQVLSVWGIAGTGKSALVKTLFYGRMLDRDQFNKYIWVNVSHPFNLRDFCRSLLSDFRSKEDPVMECRELLKQYECLVVIDGLQSKEEWDSIQAALVSRPSASVLIVITSQASVATYCTDNEKQVFNVNCLDAAKAFDLFRTEVQRKAPLSPVKYLKHVELKELMLKCGGLPTVIVAIAGLLANTHGNKLMDTIHSLNSRFIHHLETNPEFGSLRGLFEWMHSVILNPPDFLKPCIFYLTIFPPNHIIRRRRLVRRWIAEGYSRGNVERQADENGEMFFSELLELSIFQQVADLVTTVTRMGFYQVNGLIREYIVSRRMEENLVLELGGSSVPLKTQNTGRHLIILESWKREQFVFENIDVSRLRSLTLFGKWESFFISKTMNLLRVLDLEDASGVNDLDLDKMMKLLHRLKFLSLRGCRDICHLPNSLGDMRQLQTLDVKGTSILTLPENITKCQKLQYIRAGSGITIVRPLTAPDSSCFPRFCRSRHLVGVEVPTEIGNLTALHTLGVINVGASGIKKELKNLTQLRKLGVSGINKHNSADFFCAIASHGYLESLSVRLENANQGCLDGISLPCENLQSLKLYGIGNKLPLSRSHLRKLGKLDLEMATLEKNDIQFLAQLQELCILRLRVKQLPDRKLHFYAEVGVTELFSFEKVKILEIDCSSSKLHVTFGSKSMKNLELLKVDCSSVAYQLTGLNYLGKLKQVLLKGTEDETMKRELESQLVNHPRKPAVKLEEVPLSS